MGNYTYLGRVYIPSPGTTNLYDFESNGSDLVGGATASFVGEVAFATSPSPFHGNYAVRSAVPSVTGTVGSVTYPNTNINTAQGTVELAFSTGDEVLDSQVIFASGGTDQARALEFNVNGTAVLCYGILNGFTVFQAGVVVPNARYYVAITWGPFGTNWYFGPVADDGSVSPTLLYSTSEAPDWGTVNNVYMFQSFNFISNFLGSVDWVRFSNIQRSSFPTLDTLAPSQPQLLFLGQDITANVTQWDEIEQIKDVLLSDAQFVTSELNLVLDNSSHFLSPEHPASMIQGRNWYNQSLQILIDGVMVFNGQVTDIQASPDDRSATIVADDLMGNLSNAVISTNGTVSMVNPGEAMLNILLGAGLGPYLDQASFLDAGGSALAAGATIQYTYDAGSNTTALAAVQDIASLASISVFVYNSSIIARAFEAYQGGGSGLRFPITDEIVRTWTEFDWDAESFNNQVSVAYVPVVGQTSPYTATNSQSVTQNNVTRAYQFDGSNVIANDLKSAQFFAETYLARASNRRGVLQFTGGQEFAQSVLGDRHWVTSVDMGLSNFPMEIIEIHRHLDTDDIDVTMVALANGNEAQPVFYEENWREFIPGATISYLPGWKAVDTSPGPGVGSGLIEYNNALGGQVGKLIPETSYDYSLQYWGAFFGDLDLKFHGALFGLIGEAKFWVLLRVQAGLEYPSNAYYLAIEPGSNLFVLGQFNAGIAYPAVSIDTVGYDVAKFSLEIIAKALDVTVLLNGVKILNYNFNEGPYPGMYSGAIGFTGLGYATAHSVVSYEIADIVVSQPQ